MISYALLECLGLSMGKTPKFMLEDILRPHLPRFLKRGGPGEPGSSGDPVVPLSSADMLDFNGFQGLTAGFLLGFLLVFFFTNLKQVHVGVVTLPTISWTFDHV